MHALRWEVVHLSNRLRLLVVNVGQIARYRACPSALAVCAPFGQPANVWGEPSYALARLHPFRVGYSSDACCYAVRGCGVLLSYEQSVIAGRLSTRENADGLENALFLLRDLWAQRGDQLHVARMLLPCILRVLLH